MVEILNFMCILSQLIIIKKTTAGTFGLKRTNSFSKYLLSVSVCETQCWALETVLFIALRVD